uniref:Rapamycin-insensitive companion of mTOR n=1 Tax=Phallusia mammillata TaxID=59560 RepID=A0A6F9DRB5_9ASCI|nr:rapamycin-insensitive companion of mTOR [Phallusia mammillata]
MMKSVVGGPSTSRRIKSLKIRSGRPTFGRSDHLDDNIPLDLTRDPNDILKEVLLNVCNKQGITTARKLGHLNNLVKLYCNLSDESQIKIPMEVIMSCLKATLVSDVKEVRAAGVRALRYLINNSETKQVFMDLNLDYLITKCLDISHFNEVERIQAIRLVRKLAHLKRKDSNSFEPVIPLSLFACIVSVSLGGAEERDRVYRTCLAVLCELAVIQPWLLLRCNGVLAMINAILECHMYHRISECLCMSLMHLINHPSIRQRNAPGLDMGPTFAPFTELNYRLHPDVEDSKLKEEQEMRFSASKMAIVSLLRTWSGILHVCHSQNMIRSFVEALLIPSSTVRRGIMMVLCDLFYFNELTWTDDFEVALSRAAPGNFKDNWRLSDGFVVSEGKCLLPVRAVARPDLVDCHLAILLLAFLKEGLLKCLSSVALSSDPYSSVGATIILGKVLHLSSRLLPSDSSNSWKWHLPHLFGDGVEDLPNEEQLRVNVTVKQLQEIHMMETSKVAHFYSLYLAQLQHDQPREHNGSPRRVSVVGLPSSRGRSGSSSSLDPLMSPTNLFIRRHRSLNLMRDFTEENTLAAIKSTRVLATKNNREWDWDALECLFLSPPSASFLRGVATDDTLRRFYRRLIYFYLPASKLFCSIDLCKDGIPDHNRKFVTTACYMVQFLAHSDEEGQRLLKNMVTAIVESLPEITSEASGYSKAVGSLAVTCSREYFLILGALSCDPRGDQVLGYCKAYHYFLGLASEGTHENMIKLLVSSLHYTEDSPSRAVLNKVLTTCNEAGRLYGTGFLRVLLRANCPGFQSWGTELLTTQLFDKSNEVAAEALDILHEACDDREYLQAVVKLRPTLLHLGERGAILVCRFLSDPQGFEYHAHNRYLARELERWWNSYNERYVLHVEELLKLSLTTYERPNKEEGFVRRSGHRKGRNSVYLPAHLYGELCRLEKGVKVVVEEEITPRLTNILRNMMKGDREPPLHKGTRTKEDQSKRLIKMKSCLWALAHIGSTALGLPLLRECGALPLFTELASQSGNASVRGTCIYCLSCMAQTIPGVEAIQELGWKSVLRTVNKPEPGPARKHSALFEPEVTPQMTRGDLMTKSISSSSQWSTASSASHLRRSPRRSASNLSTSSHGREKRSRAISRTSNSESGSSFRRSRRNSKKNSICEDVPSPTTTTSASTSMLSSHSSIFENEMSNSVNSSMNVSKTPSPASVHSEKLTSSTETTATNDRRSNSLADKVVTSNLNVSNSKTKFRERVWGTVNNIFKKTKSKSITKTGFNIDRKKQTDETSSGYVSDHHPFEQSDLLNLEQSVIEENEAPPSPRPSPPQRGLLSSGTLTSSSNASVDTLKMEISENAINRKSSEYSLKTELSVTPGNATNELNNVSSWNRNNSGQTESIPIENSVGRPRGSTRFYVAQSDYDLPRDGDMERCKRSQSLPDVLEREVNTTNTRKAGNSQKVEIRIEHHRANSDCSMNGDGDRNFSNQNEEKLNLSHSRSDGNLKDRLALDLPLKDVISVILSNGDCSPKSPSEAFAKSQPSPIGEETNPISENEPIRIEQTSHLTVATTGKSRLRGNTEISLDSCCAIDTSSPKVTTRTMEVDKTEEEDDSQWRRSKPRGLAAVRRFNQQIASPSSEARKALSDQSDSSSDEITVEERDDIISATRFVGIAIPEELSYIFNPLHQGSRKDRETLSSILSTWKDPVEEETASTENPGKQKVIDLLQGRKFRGLDEYTFGPAVAAALKANKPGRSHSTVNTPCARTPDSMLSEASDLCYLGGQAMEPGSDEYVAILHEEIIQLVVNLGSSVGIKAHETALLMMKEKRPEVFDSVSLYNSIVQIMSEYSFRLTTRRFVQELFQDVHFTEVYQDAQRALQSIR